MGQLQRSAGEGVPSAEGDFDLGSAGLRAEASRRGHLRGSGGAPGNTCTWVGLKDDLTASLLQAALSSWACRSM